MSLHFASLEVILFLAKFYTVVFSSYYIYLLQFYNQLCYSDIFMCTVLESILDIQVYLWEFGV